jgi:hypothetical protein
MNRQQPVPTMLQRQALAEFIAKHSVPNGFPTAPPPRAPEPANFCAPADPEPTIGEVFNWTDAVIFLAAGAVVALLLVGTGIWLWLS